MLKIQTRFNRVSKFCLLFILASILIVFAPLYVGSQNVARIEISLDLGYTYQPQKILNDHFSVFIRSKDLSQSIVPSLGIAITKIGKSGIHKIRGSFGGWHHSVTHSDLDGTRGSSFSNSYCFISYQYGKRWNLLSKEKMTFQATIGPNFAIRQTAELNTREEFSYVNNGRFIMVEAQEYTEPDVSLGVVLETNLAVKIYKGLSLQLGLNGFYWPITVYGDRNYTVKIDNVEVPDVTIRSFKHIFSFSGGLKLEI